MAPEKEFTMELIAARAETDHIIDGLVSGLTPEHREMKTPCKKWVVHDLVNHMVGGALMISSALSQDPSAMPEPEADHLPDGPAAGWAAAVAAMAAAATKENLEEQRQLPFGEVPGAVGFSVITADHLTHAWDLAKATNQPIQASEDLSQWAIDTWGMVLTDDARNGDNFDAVQPCDDDAPGIDKLAAFTGRVVA
jgi:uncharacterized protein (TIGR03086 family)